MYFKGLRLALCWFRTILQKVSEEVCQHCSNAGIKIIFRQ